MTDEYRKNEFLENYLQIPSVQLEKLYERWGQCDPQHFKPIA